MTSNSLKSKPSMVRKMPHRKEVKIIRQFNLFINCENSSSPVYKVIERRTNAESEPSRGGKRKEGIELSAPNSKNVQVRNGSGIVGKKSALGEKSSIKPPDYALSTLEQRAKSSIKSSITSSSNESERLSAKLPSTFHNREVLVEKVQHNSNDNEAANKESPSAEEGELPISKPIESGECTTLTASDGFSPSTSFEVISPFGQTNHNSISIDEINAKRELKCSLLYDENGNLPLHKAVIIGKLSDVIQQCRVLVDGGLSVDLKNNDNQTALHLAVEYEESEITEQLLKFKADPSEKDGEGNTALHLSIRKRISDHKPPECFELLIKSIHLPKMINSFNDQGFSPLHRASFYGSYEEAVSIIEAGAVIDLKDRLSGRTALFHAVEQRSLEVIKLLMDFDADETAKNMSGQSPIMAVSKLYGVRTTIYHDMYLRRRKNNRKI